MLVVGIMIELRPLDVYFDLNQEEILRNYTCSYKASEPLGEIAFYTDSLPIMSSSVMAMNSSLIDTNSSVISSTNSSIIAVNNSEPKSAALTFHESYSSSNSLSQTIRITKGTKYVRCKVFDRDTIERGSMASRVHYISNNRLSTLKRGFMLGTEFYTMNGLPLREFSTEKRSWLHSFVGAGSIRTRRSVYRPLHAMV